MMSQPRMKRAGRSFATRAACSIVTAICCATWAGCAASRGDRAPNWTLEDIHGKTHTMASYEGNVVLLDFWATWCGPCIAASPHLQSLSERFKNRDFRVVAIHFDDNGDPAAYAKTHDYTYDSMVSGRSVARAYGVSMIPTVILVNKQGVIVHRQTGFSGKDDEQRLAGMIERELGR